MANSHVRAEEFNSILENTPEVAARIAKGLGVSQGQLRNMVVAGELLSKDVFEVLLEQSGEINSEFAEIPKTMSRASSELSSAFNEWANRLDRAHGITESIAQLMSSAAEAFRGPTQDDVLNRYADVRVRIADINTEMQRLQQLNAQLEGGFFTAGTVSDNLARIDPHTQARA